MLVYLAMLYIIIKFITLYRPKGRGFWEAYFESYNVINQQRIRNATSRRLKKFYKTSNIINILFYIGSVGIVVSYVLMQMMW